MDAVERVATGEGRWREGLPIVWVIGYLACTIAPKLAHPEQIKLYMAQPIGMQHCGSQA